MKKQNILLLMMVVAMFGLNGCKGASEKALSDKEGSKDYAEILAEADSLVDISPDSSLVLCKEYLESHTTPNDSLYAQAKLIEGNAYFSIGDVEEAEESMKQAREIAKENANEYVLINATTDLGVVKRVSQQPDSAMALYKEALGQIGGGQYKEEKAHLLTSIAILYANTGHLDEARDYADQAVAAARESKDMEMIMYAMSQTGAIYNLLGNRAKGLQLAQEALRDARNMNQPRYEIKTLAHLIDMHLREGNKDSVEYYLKRGRELSARFPENSVEVLGFLEEEYVVLAALGRHRESLDIQRRLLNQQNKSATFMPKEKLWLRMARNYAALHQEDSASYSYERSIELTDSMRQVETDKQLSEFYARYKTSEKELALANMAQKKARLEKWIAISVTIAIMVVILGILYNVGRKKKERLDIMRSRIKGIEEERRRLAKELHDGVCNDLYGVEMLMQVGRPKEELQEELGKIREEARRISHELMPPSLQDVTLPQAIGDMVNKLSHTYPDKTFNLTVEGKEEWAKVPDNVTYSLYRVCQELIGNMLRHSTPSELALKLTAETSEMKIELTHNGKAKTDKTGRGIGLESVRARLAVIDATAEGLPTSQTITITRKMQ